MKGILFLLLVFLLQSCWRPEREPQPSTEYEPVLMTRSEMERSIEFKPSRPLKSTGKIYFKDNYLFIVENYHGVHIINNTNPASPTPEGFIVVPGCVDVAMKGEVMYIDNAVDLLAIDIRALPAIKIAQRVKNVFPELLPPDLQTLPKALTAGSRPENTLIVEWTKKQQD